MWARRFYSIHELFQIKIQTFQSSHPCAPIISPTYYHILSPNYHTTTVLRHITLNYQKRIPRPQTTSLKIYSFAIREQAKQKTTINYCTWIALDNFEHLLPFSISKKKQQQIRPKRFAYFATKINGRNIVKRRKIIWVFFYISFNSTKQL